MHICLYYRPFHWSLIRGRTIFSMEMKKHERITSIYIHTYFRQDDLRRYMCVYCCVWLWLWFNFKFNRNGESALELSKEVNVYIFKQIYG